MVTVIQDHRVTARGPARLDTLARFGLPAPAAEATVPPSSEGWSQLLIDVGRERMEGLLVAAVGAGAIPVTPEQRDEVRSAGRGRARVDLSLERELLTLAGVLDAEGISYRVIKGPAWAHTAYPDPSWRGFGDVDLLIATEDWYRAVAVVESRGARRVLPEVRPGFDRRFGKDATLIATSGWEIDLHRTLVAGPFGLWADRAALWAGSAEVTIGGVALPILDAETAFLHACYNAALADDPPRLIAVRDVAQMVFGGRLDPHRVEHLAEEWQAGVVVAKALGLAARMLTPAIRDQPVATPFAALRATPWDRALLASYRGPGRGYTSQVAAVVAVEGARGRLAYLTALARPQPSYLAARGVSPLAYLGRGARRVFHRP